MAYISSLALVAKGVFDGTLAVYNYRLGAEEDKFKIAPVWNQCQQELLSLVDSPEVKKRLGNPVVSSEITVDWT